MPARAAGSTASGQRGGAAGRRRWPGRALVGVRPRSFARRARSHDRPGQGRPRVPQCRSSRALRTLPSRGSCVRTGMAVPSRLPPDQSPHPGKRKTASARSARTHPHAGARRAGALQSRRSLVTTRLVVDRSYGLARDPLGARRVVRVRPLRAISSASGRAGAAAARPWSEPLAGSGWRRSARARVPCARPRRPHARPHRSSCSPARTRPRGVAPRFRYQAGGCRAPWLAATTT